MRTLAKCKKEKFIARECPLNPKRMYILIGLKIQEKVKIEKITNFESRHI